MEDNFLLKKLPLKFYIQVSTGPQCLKMQIPFLEVVIDAITLENLLREV